MADRAQNESIGVILLVGVVIITVSVGGVYAIGTVTQSAGGPDAAFTGEIGTDGITLFHQGGDSLRGDDLRVIVRKNGSETGIAWSDGTLSGDDSSFDPGEEWNVSRSYDPGSLVSVTLVDNPSNTVLFQTEATVKPQEPVVSGVGGNIDAIDRQGEIKQSDISTPPSDGTGDDEEGEDADGPSEPWLDVDDDGRFEEEDGDVTVDLSSGSIPSDQVDKARRSTLRVPSETTTDTGGSQIKIQEAENIRIAGTLRTNSKLELSAPGSIDLNDGRLYNDDGDGQVVVTADEGLSASGTVVRSKDKIDYEGSSISLPNADMDNTAGDSNLEFTAKTGGITVDGSSLKSKGQTTLTAKEGSISAANTNIDNSAGDSKVAIESKTGGFDAADASIRSRGKVTITTDSSITLTDGLLDNSAGDGKIQLEVKSDGDISLVRATVRSDASATASVKSGSDSVDVTDAIIDDEDDFLEVDPQAAATGDPKEGGAGKA